MAMHPSFTSLTLSVLLVTTVLAQSGNSCLRTCLTGKSVPSFFSDSSQWTDLTSPYNLRLVYKPAAVVTATTTLHVSEAVKCANLCGNVKVQAKSGGHSYASYSSGGQDASLIIDLASMNDVTVHANDSASLGPGIRFGNLDFSLYRQNKRAISHGTCANVGLGGHITHGEYGTDSRSWGLALDHVQSLEIVLADGSVVLASPASNEDIYWAARGAADSIGIVTRLNVRTQPAPSKLVYFSYNLSNAMKSKAAFVSAFRHIQDFAQNTSVVDRQQTWGMWLGSDSWSLQGKFFGNLTDWKRRIKPELLRTLPKPVNSDVREVDWLKAQALFHGSEDVNSLLQPNKPGEYHEHDTFYTKSLTIPDPMTNEALGEWYTYVTTAGASIRSPNQFSCDFDLSGGADSQINIYNETWAAFQPRNALWTVQMTAGVESGSYNNSLTGFVNGMSQALTKRMPNTKFGAYHNYIDPELAPANAHNLYYGSEVYSRLLAIKKRLDPRQLFWNPLAVGVGDF